MRRVLIVIVAGLLALAIFGVAGAVQDPRIVRYTVALDRLPPGSKPIRIVQLSDTHGSWIDMPPVRLERIVAQANALKPDLIVLTGDYIGGKVIDWPHIRLEKVLLPFDRLTAPLGVYAVVGNHDTVYWTRFVLRKTHVRVLVAEVTDAGPVVLAGSNDITNQFAPPAETRALAGSIVTAKPLIFVSHEPDFFQWLPKRVDLMLAGHTHGGQIRLPLLGGIRADPFTEGHWRGQFLEHGQTLIVSSGIGTSLIPVRVGVPPEIVEITLVPKV